MVGHEALPNNEDILLSISGQIDANSAHHAVTPKETEE